MKVPTEPKFGLTTEIVYLLYEIDIVVVLQIFGSEYVCIIQTYSSDLIKRLQRPVEYWVVGYSQPASQYC